jgi:hypothetical protein
MNENTRLQSASRLTLGGNRTYNSVYAARRLWREGTHIVVGRLKKTNSSVQTRSVSTNLWGRSVNAWCGIVCNMRCGED